MFIYLMLLMLIVFQNRQSMNNFFGGTIDIFFSLSIYQVHRKCQLELDVHIFTSIISKYVFIFFNNLFIVCLDL